MPIQVRLSRFSTLVLTGRVYVSRFSSTILSYHSRPLVNLAPYYTASQAATEFNTARYLAIRTTEEFSCLWSLHDSQP